MTTAAPTPTNGHHRTDPRKIENLHEYAQAIIDRMRELQERQLDAYTRKLYRLANPKLASDYTAEITALRDELEILLAEANRRKI